MQIYSYLKESLNNFPGRISTVIFTPGCNYRCPACHAKQIVEAKGNFVNEEEVFSYLAERKGWIDGVVICGGEPTRQIGLVNFVKKLKKRTDGLPVKLDTNGSNFGVLQELRDQKLVDYVAMDVKGPPELYHRLVGKDFIDLRDDVEKAMAIVQQFPEYEYRQTVVPVIREDGKISFLTSEEIGKTAKSIVDVTGKNDHIFYLQKFVPRSPDEMIDPRMSKMTETPQKLLDEMCEAAKKYLPNCMIR